MDPVRLRAYLRWTKRHFGKSSLELIWKKIQKNPRMMQEYKEFDTMLPRTSPATANVEWAIKLYGWEELLNAMWLFATGKEQTMINLGLQNESEKWSKVKEKLATIPKSVQM